MNSYRERVNAENLAAQHNTVRAKAGAILEELETIKQYLYWALDPDEKDHDYYVQTLIEHAHMLVDLGHEYRARLVANPAPKDEEDVA